MSKNIIIVKFNSILLSLASLFTGALVLFYSHKILMPLFLIVSAVVKIIGLVSLSTKMRICGLLGINVSWALLSLWFLQANNPDFMYAGLFALFILAFGIGISIQERFDGD